jgi:hypothetical protein
VKIHLTALGLSGSWQSVKLITFFFFFLCVIFIVLALDREQCSKDKDENDS